MHWINVMALSILLPSGLQIFNAHPALYWGHRSDPGQAILEMKAVRAEDGELRGITSLWGKAFDTTGVLGASRNAKGERQARGFPLWAILPSGQLLAVGRRWHFFFAWVLVLNGIAFWVYALLSGHLIRDLLPRWSEWRGGLRQNIRAHALRRGGEGTDQEKYNPAQKLVYFLIIFIMGPMIVLTGLAMSPWLDAAFPWLLALFGGRQAARTVHFLLAFGLLGFTLL
jgi:thiosulfate reductase cytochrome b subunit